MKNSNSEYEHFIDNKIDDLINHLRNTNKNYKKQLKEYNKIYHKLFKELSALHMQEIDNLLNISNTLSSIELNEIYKTNKKTL